MGKDWSTISLLKHCSSLQLEPILRPKIRVSKLGFSNLVYIRNNCVQLDEGFYPKLNNIAKVGVNLKALVFFHSLCSLFSFSPHLSR